MHMGKEKVHVIKRDQFENVQSKKSNLKKLIHKKNFKSRKGKSVSFRDESRIKDESSKEYIGKLSSKCINFKVSRKCMISRLSSIPKIVSKKKIVYRPSQTAAQDDWCCTCNPAKAALPIIHFLSSILARISKNLFLTSRAIINSSTNVENLVKDYINQVGQSLGRTHYSWFIDLLSLQYGILCFLCVFLPHCYGFRAEP